MLQPDDFSENDDTPSDEPRPSLKDLFHHGFLTIVRSGLAVIGILLIPVGIIVAFLTPVLPVGLPIVILGVVLIARNFPWGRRLFQAILKKYPALERFAPDWLLKLIFGELPSDEAKSED